MSNSVKERFVSFLKKKSSTFREDTELSNDLFAELALDSLGFVELLQDLESEFNITFTDTEAQQINTFQELLSLIETKLPG